APAVACIEKRCAERRAWSKLAGPGQEHRVTVCGTRDQRVPVWHSIGVREDLNVDIVGAIRVDERREPIDVPAWRGQQKVRHATGGWLCTKSTYVCHGAYCAGVWLSS